MSFMDGLTDFVGNIGNNIASNPYALQAAGMAAQQWHNADQYRQVSHEAADRSDPFGQYRRGYGDKLQGLYDDPSSIENTPGYKFTRDQAMNTIASKMRSAGLGGSAQAQQQMQQEAAGLASQTWNTEANRLAQLAGSQFDPANAGRMMMQGNDQKLQAENNAMGALAFLGAPQAGGDKKGGGSGGYGSMNPMDVFSRLSAAAGPGGIIQGGGTVAQLFQKYLTSPGDMTPADIHLMESLGIPTGVDTGAMDHAPGGYDSSGFGGYGTASGDPTLQGINYGGNFDPTYYPDVIGNTGSDYGINYTPPDIDMTGFQVDPWG